MDKNLYIRVPAVCGLCGLCGHRWGALAPCKIKVLKIPSTVVAGKVEREARDRPQIRLMQPSQCTRCGKLGGQVEVD